MSDLEKRLRASVRLDAVNGDSRERAICGRQMLEAANYIQQLEAERTARLAAPEPATVAVDAGALDELREAMGNLREPMSRPEYAVARARIVEAAWCLLEGGE